MWSESMMHRSTSGLGLTLALILAAGGATAQPHGHGGGGGGGGGGGRVSAAPRGEPHAGPRGYTRPAAPAGWNARPATVDRGAYQHNYQAARSYRIGPYHAPAGWGGRRWGYGQILPRAYWGSQYLLGDYWLFGLEVPPVGYEWVRVGPDALLINTFTGEILQVEYGVFG
jgi:Ni/Co efflux regulator RcnB